MRILDAVHPTVEHSAVEGFDAVTLTAGPLEAAFVPRLGMVGASLRHAGEELHHRYVPLRQVRASAPSSP
jgi:hypothetical protein